MKVEKEFSNKTLNDIRWWAWVGAVLPITALAGLFFVWMFGTDTLVNLVMIAGATSMFSIAVIWWWWAIFVIAKIIKQEQRAIDDIKSISVSMKDFKKLFEETFKDK
jgi:hypothetical protein